MVIVDTSVWIDFFRDVDNIQTVWLESEVTRQRIGLTDLILCEVLQGVRNEKNFQETRRDLSHFAIFPSTGEELAVASARNFRSLRARGITTRKTIDCLIATFCIEAGHTLLHRDRDFDAFEHHLGLQVLHPGTA